MTSSTSGKLPDQRGNGIQRSSNLIEQQQNPVTNDIVWPFWRLLMIGLAGQTVAFALGYIIYLCSFFNLGAVWPWDILYMIIKPIVKSCYGMLVASKVAETEDARQPYSTTPPPWQSRPVVSLFYADRYLGGSPHYEIGVYAAAAYGICALANTLMWAYVKRMLNLTSSTAMVESENDITKAMAVAKDQAGAALVRRKKE